MALPRVLAVASGGGHLEQLLLLESALEKFDTVYVTTRTDAFSDKARQCFVIQDCNRSTPVNILHCLAQSTNLIRKLRPAVVVSTGALPGLIMLAVASLFGIKTIWIDSIANVQRLSWSGAAARRFASLCITQWPDLQNDPYILYRGSLL
jgi:UDP-N-acetylglucosamine:LPS N-acetylglucosamine transferase